MKTLELIINDESRVNDRGYRVLNAGLDATRYLANPVLLYQHDIERVIGRCERLETRGPLLVGHFVFDEGDPQAKEVLRKLEADFLRGVSPCLFIASMTYSDTGDCVDKWELFEVSVVTIPSNPGALRLCNSQGQPLEEDELKEHLEQLRSDKTNIEKNKKNMDGKEKKNESVALSAKALKVLGCDTAISVDELSASIEKMGEEIASLRGTAEQMRLAARKSLIDAALNDGKIESGERKDFEDLYDANPELCARQLSKLRASESLTSQVDKSGKPSADSRFSGSWDELDKSNRLAALKKENPELFAEKFEEKFGHKPNQ